MVSQGNYEDTTGHLEKWPPGKKQKNHDDDDGVTAVLSLQWCLRGTLKLKMAPGKKTEIS